ncbi:MAG: DUF2127 domain-containing protein [Candidatus Sulfotelmatobacter sp.]
MAAAPPFNPDSRTDRANSVREPRVSRRRVAGGHLLRLIAVFKFLKAASLIALSVGVFRLMHQNLGERLARWILAMRLDPGNRHVTMLLARASNLTPEQIKKLGLVGLIYAALFLVEGTGLWMQKRWGEWVTVVITGTLVPVEVYEISRHPGVGKVLVLILNIAVVGYLIYRIRTEDAGSPR